MKRRAVFFDRDGTIIEERRYLKEVSQVLLLPGAAEAIQSLSMKGYVVIMVSNQSGIARGMFSESRVQKVNQRVQELLRQKGACFDAMYYCPHHPNGSVPGYAFECGCRKPAPGMGRRAAAEYGIDLTSSYMVGDKTEDIMFGQNCGMKNAYLVSTGYGRQANLVEGYGVKVKDALDAARKILSETY